MDIEGGNIHEEGKEVVKWVEPAHQQLLAMQLRKLLQYQCILQERDLGKVLLC